MTEDTRDRLHLIADIAKAWLALMFVVEWALRGIFYMVNNGFIY